MSLLQLLEKTTTLLKEKGIDFALSGGILADYYRKEARATDDIDLLVALNEKDASIGKTIIEELGFDARSITEAALKGDTHSKRKLKDSPPQIIVGRKDGKAYGVDFLLLTFPWGESALRRAKRNVLDFGVGGLPSLTVEDMTISKLFAIKNNSTRVYMKSDIPDVSLMLLHNAIDIEYLSKKMIELELILPKGLEKEAHQILSRISRKNRKKNRALEF